MKATTQRISEERPPAPDSAIQSESEVSAPTEKRIAELAYSYWEARGRQGGSPWEDWFRAEQDLKRRRDN